MGDVSIIARRLAPDVVQYGWSGNGGYFKNVGLRLLEWYDPKDGSLVDYLFDLGQFMLLGHPGSEKGGYSMFKTHDLTGKPHWMGRSEREIFSKIAFIDYGYFLDSDKTWYYVNPGPFRIKIPLELIANNLDKEYYEFDFLSDLRKKVVACALGLQNDDFDAVFRENKLDRELVKDKVLSDEYPVHRLFKDYAVIWKYFDDWVVVRADEKMEKPKEIVMRRAETKDQHTETCFWTDQDSLVFTNLMQN